MCRAGCSGSDVPAYGEEAEGSGLVRTARNRLGFRLGMHLVTRKRASHAVNSAYPTTPDGRYFVVKGRLWRCTNPALEPEVKQKLVRELMEARRAKGEAMRHGDAAGQERARQWIDEVKHELGERGPAWWTDGSPDWNRHMARNTPYADWFLSVS